METWLRITLVVVAAAWMILAGVWLERRLHARLARLGGRSVVRGLAVGIGYPLLNLVAYALWGFVVVLLAEALGGRVAMILALFVGLVLIGPFGWCLMSPASQYAPSQPFTVAADLRRSGATPGASRAMGIAGAICTWLLAMPGAFTFGVLVLVL